jgi:hypothetical protein
MRAPWIAICLFASAFAQDPPRPALKPMAADHDPAFEVAAVKPSDPNIQRFGFTVQGRRFSTNNTSLASIIWWAYGIDRQQLVNAPSWIASEDFDLTGEPDGEGQASKQQWQIMMRKLLSERFKLRFIASSGSFRYMFYRWARPAQSFCRPRPMVRREWVFAGLGISALAMRQSRTSPTSCRRTCSTGRFSTEQEFPAATTSLSTGRPISFSSQASGRLEIRRQRTPIPNCPIFSPRFSGNRA